MSSENAPKQNCAMLGFFIRAIERTLVRHTNGATEDSLATSLVPQMQAAMLRLSHRNKLRW
jgi:hypothetical protein